jgi:phosphatidylinositol kinase/protein kinase (PI-3  family)
MLVTSKSAASWIQRSTTFARSWGALSGIAVGLGNLSMGTDLILVDRTNGAVTSASFVAVVKPVDTVPFRLTRMVRLAFGSAGYEGPFRTELTASLTVFRKFASQLAPVLQLAIGSPHFDQPTLPTAFLEFWKSERNYPDTTEKLSVSTVYERFAGTGNTVDQVVSDAIAQATSLEMIAKMPDAWVPWW